MAKLIALDAGHGSDTYERDGGKGVVRNGNVFEEHTFNAAVIIKLKELLELNGFDTFYTQPPNEEEVGLQERTNMANRRNADLYWSVHANASSHENTRGVCAFYWYNSEAGQRLAQLFAENALQADVALHGDGTHASQPGSWTNLHVVRETEMTALLTETGFMTNEQDLQLLRSTSYRNKIARIHAKTICEFYGKEFKEEGVKGVSTNVGSGDGAQNPTTNDVPEWKYNGIEYLAEMGLLNNEEIWRAKVNEPMPVWAVTILLKRIHEDKS